MSSDWLHHYSEVRSLLIDFGIDCPGGMLVIRESDVAPTQKIAIICVVKNVHRDYKMSEALKQLGHYWFMHWQHNLHYPDSDRMDACVILMGTVQYLNSIPYHYLPVDRIASSDLPEYCSPRELEFLKQQTLNSITTGRYHDGYSLISPIRRQASANLRHTRGLVNAAMGKIANHVEDTAPRCLNGVNTDYGALKRMRTSINKVMEELIELERKCSARSPLING